MLSYVQHTCTEHHVHAKRENIHGHRHTAEECVFVLFIILGTLFNAFMLNGLMAVVIDAHWKLTTRFNPSVIYARVKTKGVAAGDL